LIVYSRQTTVHGQQQSGERFEDYSLESMVDSSWLIVSRQTTVHGQQQSGERFEDYSLESMVDSLWKIST
jgi:hypothetical protein